MCPWILRLSLENRIVRTYNILVELLQSDGKAIEVIKRNPYVLNVIPEDGIIPNTNILKDSGVSASIIFRLFRNHWRCIESNTVKFGKIVEELKEMGFDPLKWKFVEAIVVLTVLRESKWDTSVEIYKRWGWSDKDISTAFKKHPMCMAYSEDNIMGTMDFYVNKLGLDSSIIVNCPTLVGYSLKKRLIPRGAVIECLLSKGLVKPDSKLSSMFICTEKHFLEKYVNSHEDASHLINLYNEKLNLL